MHITALKSPEQRSHKKHYTCPLREIITSENKSVYNLVHYRIELVMLSEFYSLKRLSAIMLIYNSESIIPTCHMLVDINTEMHNPKKSTENLYEDYFKKY